MTSPATQRDGGDAGVHMAGEEGPDAVAPSAAPGTGERPGPPGPAAGSAGGPAGDHGAAPRTPGPPGGRFAAGPPAPAEQLDTLPPTAPAERAPATPLGSRYVLDNVIGSGATGRVWRGRRRADDAAVAVKVLRSDFTDDADAVVRFLRQRTVLQTLEHPHLVRVHDLVAEGDVLAIVMDLVDGEDLRQLAGRRALRADQQLVLLGQVAAALAEVHAAGVVHRDIKPENILVTWHKAEPYALLTDFGLARIADGPNVTRMSQLVGTPAYVAPELVESRPAGPPCDVYSLGVTLYELLSGQRPFQADSTAGMLRAHLEAEPVRPPGLDGELWELVRACLAKDPGARPAASDLSDRLLALGRRGQAPPPVPPPPPDGSTPRPYGTAFSPASGTPGAAERPPDAGPDAGAGAALWTPPMGQTRPGTAAPVGMIPPAPVAVDPPSPAGHGSPDGAYGPPGPGRAGPAGGSDTGHGDPGQVGGDVAVHQPTTGATRPAPAESPPAPPRRRRRAPLVIAVVACVLVAAGAGVWLGRPEPRPAAAKPAPSRTTSPYRLYYLPVTATSPRAGAVRLQFPDASNIAGFRFYLIFRDRDQIGEAYPGQSPPYTVPSVDTRTRHCWAVAALLETDQPPPAAAAKPACRVADGRPAEG